MKKITESQIDKINKYMERMNELQKDAYVYRLEEAGIIQSILAKFGSPASNLKKLQKQRTAIIKQLDNMIKVISVSKAKNLTVQQKQDDIKALTDLKQKVLAIDLNVNFPENTQPVQEEKNK